MQLNKPLNQICYNLLLKYFHYKLIFFFFEGLGFVWINEVGRHFLGAPFGGYKQSGLGREEGIGELISFTQEKNVHINLAGQ